MPLFPNRDTYPSSKLVEINGNLLFKKDKGLSKNNMGGVDAVLWEQVQINIFKNVIWPGLVTFFKADIYKEKKYFKLLADYIFLLAYFLKG